MSMTAMWRKFTDEEFKAIVLKSKSMSEVMYNLGYRASTGRSRAPVKQRILELGLEIPQPNDFEKTKKANEAWRIPDKDYFIKDKERKGVDLRKRLLNGYKENKCEICGLPGEWNGQPLNLHVDHINGDHFDNRLENLRLICPNCHSQTNTYCGKNIKKHEE